MAARLFSLPLGLDLNSQSKKESSQSSSNHQRDDQPYTNSSWGYHPTVNPFTRARYRVRSLYVRLARVDCVLRSFILVTNLQRFIFSSFAIAVSSFLEHTGFPSMCSARLPRTIERTLYAVVPCFGLCFRARNVLTNIRSMFFASLRWFPTILSSLSP